MAVAAKHYLHVTEEHFQRAVSVAVEAVRNAVQRPQESACAEAHVVTRNVENHGKSRGFLKSRWTILDSNQ